MISEVLFLLFCHLCPFLVSPAGGTVAEGRQQKQAAGGMVLDSLGGPVTAQERAAFYSFIKSYDPNPDQNDGNVWVYGNPGKAIEACGLMFEITGDTAVLDRMIYYADRALAGRNDLAGVKEGGGRLIWTGRVEPVWPSNHLVPGGAGVEQGAVISHLAYTARLILEHPACWSRRVPGGDPHHFGETYKQRALTYIRQGDFVIDHWILPHFIRRSDHNRYYFPGAPNTYKAGQPAPWNQAFMLSDGLIRLTTCHRLLDDDPKRVAEYDRIVLPNLAWFFSVMKKNTSAAGTPVYRWRYALHQQTEDANHFAYEAEGLWIAYRAGRYGVSFEDILPFANTYTDVIVAGKKNGRFAGRVDGTTGTGHAGGDRYVRDEYLYFAVFRPDRFSDMCQAEIADGKIAYSPAITARILWLKQHRFLGDLKINKSNHE